MKLKIFTTLTFLFILVNVFSQKSGYKQFGSKTGIVYDICFSKNGSLLVIPERNVINVYDVKTQQVVYTLENGHSRDILSVDISADSSLLVSGGRDSLVVLWDLKTKKIVAKHRFHKGVVTSVRFSPNQNYFASGSSDKTVCVYNLKSDSVEYKLANHTDDITSVTFSANNRLLACSSGDHTISIVQTGSWKLAATLTDHKSWVREVKFSTDNTQLFSCSDNSKVMVWNVFDLKNINKVEETRQGFKWLLSIDLFPNQKIYATGGTAGKIRINALMSRYKYKVGKPIHKIIFKPNEGLSMVVAVATRGKGVLLIRADEMSYY